ncbi:MAG: hypothetical protein H8E12_07565 [Rhodobacteraceae bacterium]|nr:hypothetical protein [Paracoccaceae bacterium]
MKAELTTEKSLSIITQMIEESKQSFKHHSFFFLLWGWLMIAASLTEYYLMSIQYPHHFIGWIIFSSIGAILSAIKGRKLNEMPKTFADKIMSYTWVGFMITMIISLIGIIPGNPNPYILLLAGMATFISGGITNFKGFIVGGIIFWIAGFIAFETSHQISLLVYAAAILFGYIIPGYSLKKS